MPQNNEFYCSSYVEHHLKPLRKTLIAKRKSRLMSCPQAFSPVYKVMPWNRLRCRLEKQYSPAPLADLYFHWSREHAIVFWDR